MTYALTTSLQQLNQSGHLAMGLHLPGKMLQQVKDEIEADSKKWGTQGGDIDFALLVDGLAAEREQGITVDMAYRFFSTDRRKFIVADTPGHEQYTRNMVTGASTADVAVILIDARKGVLTQTRRHSFLVSLSLDDITPTLVPRPNEQRQQTGVFRLPVQWVSRPNLVAASSRATASAPSRPWRTLSPSSR